LTSEYSSLMLSGTPAKGAGVIHFSRTSQEPMFTPFIFCSPYGQATAEPMKSASVVNKSFCILEQQ
jgi:hypothetical protein